MTRIAQIEDRGATVAWSPVTGYADVIAVGAKVRYSITVTTTVTTVQYYYLERVEFSRQFYLFLLNRPEVGVHSIIRSTSNCWHCCTVQ